VKVKRRFACVVAVAAALVATAGSKPVRGQAPRPVVSHPAAPPDIAAQRALVDKYCVSCHNARLKTGGLVLDKDTVDMARVADRADVWEKVIRKLHGRMMPPQGMPRPDETTIDAFASSLESSIDRAALAKPNPGRSPLHRLNRSEYAAAIHDLLALDIDATSLLPADDEANGFDNIADVLKVSPSLLEQYLTAARKVSALAVGDLRTTPVGAVYRVPPDRSQEDHIEGLPLGTRGGALVRHNFPVDAIYEFNVVLLQNIVGYVPGLEGDARSPAPHASGGEGWSARRRRHLSAQELRAVGRAAAAVHPQS
jgi:cytochrome c5